MNDFDDRKTSLKELVEKAEKLPLLPAKTSPVQVQLKRLALSGQALSDAIPRPVKTVSRRSIKICAHAAGMIGIAAILCTAAAYVRLMRGPVSFAFLVPALQERLDAQLKGYRFRIGDAILRRGAGGGLEFRLADVSISGDDGQEIAKAPFAAVDLSETALLKLAVAPSSIELLGPQLLVFETQGGGLAFTPSAAAGRTAPQVRGASPESSNAPAIGGWTATAQPMFPAAGPSAQPLNAAALLSRLFLALDKRGGASSALERVGVRNATVYFIGRSEVSTWRIDDFHVELEEDNGASMLKGEVVLAQDDAPWRVSFRAQNRSREKLYALTASITDVVPQRIARNFPQVPALALVNLPVSGNASFDLSHDGAIAGGQAEIRFGAGEFFAPFDDKHPAGIDSGLVRLTYDPTRDAIQVAPLEVRWDGNVFNLSGSAEHRIDERTGEAEWAVNLDGRGSRLSAHNYGVAPFSFDIFRLSGRYLSASDSVILDDVRLKTGGSEIALSGAAGQVQSGGPVAVKGTVSPLPLSILKAMWPTFVAHGAREWAGSNLPQGRIAGGVFAVNLSGKAIADLNDGGDVPDNAVSMTLNFADLQIYHVKGLPPIEVKESVVHVFGRHFVYDIPGEAYIDVPSGRRIAFTDGQLAIDDLRERFPVGVIRFKGTGEAAAAMELLDQPPLGYVKAAGFKADLINGQVAVAFTLSLPLLHDVKFKQMTLSGKSRVSDLRSNALPGGLTVNGGAIAFDVSETAISANGDVKLRGVPLAISWQRIFDAPAERQPPLRVTGVLSEKAREELGLSINHILRGDAPVALSVALQKDGPPKFFAEANLTNADIFLSAIGWRKPAGQNAMLTFDLNQRPDGYLVLNNFVMAGDGLNISGRMVLNDKKRIAGFSFPQFSTNALTSLDISGELSPQNILKIQAKGSSYDGRQFFKSLFTGGKLADNQPAPLKDEPGLDLSVEIETVFGYYDSTLKSVAIAGKRRGGKLTGLEISGRLNGEAPIAVHIDQKQAESRTLTAEATDAGSVLRLVGFYPAVRGGTMTLKVNLDGSGQADKTGVLYVQSFQVAGDQVVGKVVSQAEQEGASRAKPGQRSAAQLASSGEPMQFDRMYVPFSVGAGQFALHDSAINGPLLGATLRGRIDYVRNTINLSGTYVPLYGLNAMLDAVPLFGDLLRSRDGEGVLGITFAVQGPTSNPQVLVNPVSMMAPGFLRQIFEFDTPGQIAPAQPLPQDGVDKTKGAAKRQPRSAVTPAPSRTD